MKIRMNGCISLPGFLKEMCGSIISESFFFIEIFGFDPLVVGMPVQLKPGDTVCGHVDCSGHGIFLCSLVHLQS